MITAPNTYKVNLDAIKFLSKMLRKPLASSIIGLAALNEFSALLKEQIRLVAAKIEYLQEDKQIRTGLACQLGEEWLLSRDAWDLQRYHREKQEIRYLIRRVRNYKRYLARLKAMLVNTENRTERMLAVMLASHQRVGQKSPMGKLKSDLLVEIALLTLS